MIQARIEIARLTGNGPRPLLLLRLLLAPLVALAAGRGAPADLSLLSFLGRSDLEDVVWPRVVLTLSVTPLVGCSSGSGPSALFLLGRVVG